MTRDRIQFLYPEWPAPASVRALCTTRCGGTSTGRYRSLNLGDHVGDDPAHVRANRDRVRAALNLPADPVWLTQVHGTSVVAADSVLPETKADGSHTDQRGVICAILTADCLPIFICNRPGTEVSLLHAGWRGLAAGVVEAGLAALRSPRNDLVVWLGPAIGAAAYEVGDEVRAAFVGRDKQADGAFARGQPGKWQMDIYAIARLHLCAAGVSAVYGGAYCTVSQPDLFFSHRRDGTTGRMASLLWLE